MNTEPPRRSCFCSLWDTNPQFLENQGLPRGFCGICDLCGEPGHTRHYPDPVPFTGAWCDTCYVIQAHMAPSRLLRAWYFDAATNREESIPYYSNLADALYLKLGSLRTFRNALIVELPGKFSIDLFVRKDGQLDMEFGDESRGLFGKGIVNVTIAEIALSTLLVHGNVRERMTSAGAQLEYYEEGA